MRFEFAYHGGYVSQGFWEKLRTEKPEEYNNFVKNFFFGNSRGATQIILSGSKGALHAGAKNGTHPRDVGLVPNRASTQLYAMTREAKKIIEGRTLDAILRALGTQADGAPEAGEAPDFMMSHAGRTIGIEVTMFQSGATVEGSAANRRQAEAEWEKLVSAASAYRSTRPELGDINVILTFSGALPPRRQHADFIAEIASFIGSHREQLGSQDTDFFSWDFSSPLMRDHLQALHLRICPYAIWYSSLAAGFVAMPNFSIEGIVAEKSRKEYRPSDELWLAIQSSTNISEMVITLDGVADFANVPSLDGYCFERVFVLAFDGIFQWKRSAGWSKLSGLAGAA